MISQQQAEYTRGNPINHCGVCQFYLGQHRCAQVSGDISPFGLSRVFKPEQNPFGGTLSPQEIQSIKDMAADAVDRSSEAPQQQQRPQGPPMGSIAAPGPVSG